MQYKTVLKKPTKTLLMSAKVYCIFLPIPCSSRLSLHSSIRLPFFSPSLLSCFSFFLSLRRLSGVLLMAVVINSYLLSVHISPSLPLSTLLSICLSPYHFLFNAISLSLSLYLCPLSLSLLLCITTLYSSNPALPPFSPFSLLKAESTKGVFN